jgi:hypothetical protein
MDLSVSCTLTPVLSVASTGNSGRHTWTLGGILVVSEFFPDQNRLIEHQKQIAHGLMSFECGLLTVRILCPTRLDRARNVTVLRMLNLIGSRVIIVSRQKVTGKLLSSQPASVLDLDLTY